MEVVKKELLEIKKNYKDVRRSGIINGTEIEDIANIEEELSSGYEYVDERGFLKEKGEGIFMNPTQRYAMLMKCNVEEVKRLDLMANDLDSRLLYGLEVSEEDYMSRFGEKGLKY